MIYVCEVCLHNWLAHHRLPDHGGEAHAHEHTATQRNANQLPQEAEHVQIGLAGAGGLQQHGVTEAALACCTRSSICRGFQQWQEALEAFSDSSIFRPPQELEFFGHLK